MELLKASFLAPQLPQGPWAQQFNKNINNNNNEHDTKHASYKHNVKKVWVVI